MPEPIAMWPGGFRRLGNRDIFVRSSGDIGGAAPEGHRIVYVHGLGGSSTNWTDLMGELAAGFTGEAPDLPGFGQSPPPADGNYGLDTPTAVIADLLRSGDHPAHLVGNSMGAAAALRVAAEHPELVRTLTLLSPALPDLWPRLVPYQMTGALIPVIGPAVYARIQSRPPEVRVQSVLDAIYFDPSSVSAQRVMEALEAERERDGCGHANAAVLGSLRGLVAEYLRYGPRSLWRQASGVDCPVLLCYAAEDKFVNPRSALRAARTFPRNRVVLLHETGHVPMMECPSRVAREMRAFLTWAGGTAHRSREAGMPYPTQ